MPLVARGTTGTVSAEVENGLLQPDDPAVLTLTIRDSLGSIIAGFPIDLADLVHDDLGMYHYDWVIDAGFTTGVYFASWDGVLNGEAIGSTNPEEWVVVLPGSIGGLTFTYDPTTDAGKVRLLCQDFDPEEPVFSDDEITAFIDLNQGDIRYAAAQALEVLAANEVYVQKRIKILDLWTDGPREAEQLLKIAASLRSLSDQLVPIEEMFDWAEMVYNPFTWIERIENEYLRQLA